MPAGSAYDYINYQPHVSIAPALPRCDQSSIKGKFATEWRMLAKVDGSWMVLAIRQVNVEVSMSKLLVARNDTAV